LVHTNNEYKINSPFIVPHSCGITLYAQALCWVDIRRRRDREIISVETGTLRSKSWMPGAGVKMKFAWEVFNVTNSVRFDMHSLN
jgi:hypothetical protein